MLEVEVKAGIMSVERDRSQGDYLKIHSNAWARSH